MTEPDGQSSDDQVHEIELSAAEQREQELREQDLTESEMRFVDEYMIDRNGHAAAIRAGYAVKNSYKQAQDLRNRPRVAAEIERRFGELAEQCKLSRARMIQQLETISNASVAMFMRADGSFLLWSEIPPEHRVAIKRVKFGRRESNNHAIQKLELHDPYRARQLLCQLQGWIDMLPTSDSPLRRATVVTAPGLRFAAEPSAS